jgi:amidohydrolase
MTNDFQKELKTQIELMEMELIATRKHLHQNPELSFEEYNTQAFVLKKLKEFGVSNVQKIGITGVVALIESPHALPEQSCVALRGDLDALPIFEKNEHDFVSRNDGVMHACGHDVHTTILLGCAKILENNKALLNQHIKLIFQPGEEKAPGGASILIEEGVLTNPTVKEIIALHVYPEMNVGSVGFKAGLYMASCDEIHITIHGKGGHGALPHTCIDPILIGAHLISNLQQLVSRKCDPKVPCVLSFGRFEALGATNVIPDNAILKGTFRTMNEAWREEALTFIENYTKQLCISSGATVTIEIVKGYPFLENDPIVTEKWKSVAENSFGKDKVEVLPIRMTAEDFSFYAQKIPACLMRLGVRNESKSIIHSVHHPKFDVDMKCLKIGVEAMVSYCFA